MRYVLDASAVLAVLYGEPTTTVLADAINDTPFCSAVNLAEIASKLSRNGDGERIAPLLDELTLAIVPLTEEFAMAAGELEPVGRRLGLSLADRCCLATAAAFDAVALTTDRAWLELPSVVADRVRCVRA